MSACIVTSPPTCPSTSPHPPPSRSRLRRLHPAHRPGVPADHAGRRPGERAGGRRPPRHPPARRPGGGRRWWWTTGVGRRALRAGTSDESTSSATCGPAGTASRTRSPDRRAEFAGLTGHDAARRRSALGRPRLAYVPGSSLPTDGAVATLLARQGVCRDYAHLVIALLRALDMPARLVGGLRAGALPDGLPRRRRGLRRRRLARRRRHGAGPAHEPACAIATGRDAADTAFLRHHGGAGTSTSEVGAVADVLPDDDVVTWLKRGSTITSRRC